MGYDRGDSFPFNFEPNGVPFGSKSKWKVSPRSYHIQCERKWKFSFLSASNCSALLFWSAHKWTPRCRNNFDRKNSTFGLHIGTIVNRHIFEDNLTRTSRAILVNKHIEINQFTRIGMNSSNVYILGQDILSNAHRRLSFWAVHPMAFVFSPNYTITTGLSNTQ